MAVKTETAKNPQSAAPGAPGPAAADASKAPKAEKAKRTPWGTRDAEGQLVSKLSWKAGDKTPEGYDVLKNEPLRRQDFVTLADYYEFRADDLEQRAKDMREEALAERNGTGKTTKAKQKKLVKLKDTMASLMKELQDAGVDVSSLMKA